MAAIKDVAKLAGVSASAVSKYLKTPQHMREETRVKIASAIKELNYRPNQLARSLRSGRSGVIAIPIYDIQNPYFSRFIFYIHKFCQEHDFIPLLLQVNTDHDIDNAIRILNSGLPDGAICSDDGWFTDRILQAGVSIPIVQVSPYYDSPISTAVFINLDSGMQLLCAHLEEQGVHTLAFIGSKRDYSSSCKMQAVLNYCADHKLTLDANAIFEEDDHLKIGQSDDVSYLSGFQCCDVMLQTLDTLPDAIICSSDIWAMGVLKRLTQEGIRVPDDVLLAGYDDTKLAIMSNPPLTSVHIPLDEISKAAVEKLALLMNGESVESSLMDTSLSIRTSTLIDAAKRKKERCNRE